MQLPQFYIDDLIKRAISEDINYLDVTTDYLLDNGEITTAHFISKDEGTLAGLEVALRVFTLLDSSVTFERFKKDGDKVGRGDLIVNITGPVCTLLKGERTALNLIQHMSGIATQTAKCVALCEGTNASVVETRKTLPGLRALQKYAVVMGGGRNHRFNLSDAAMLKDNHIDAFGSITAAVQALRARTGHMVMIEVEARTLADVEEAIQAGVQVIMLDNMTCAQMAEAVRLTAGRAKLEASGNITLDNIREVAQTGVDIISLGALTHSVKAFDISMRV